MAQNEKAAMRMSAYEFVNLARVSAKAMFKAFMVERDGKDLYVNASGNCGFMWKNSIAVMVASKYSPRIRGVGIATEDDLFYELLASGLRVMDFPDERGRYFAYFDPTGISADGPTRAEAISAAISALIAESTSAPETTV